MTNSVTKSTSSLFSGGKGRTYLIPKANTEVWDQLSNMALNSLGKDIQENQFNQGVDDQTKAGDQMQIETETETMGTEEFDEDTDAREYNPELVTGNNSGMTKGAKAYIKGANAAFAVQKKAQLDTAIFELQNKHRNDPDGFRKEYNEKFLPKFIASTNTQNQAAFRLEATQRFNRTHQQLLNNKFTTDAAQDQADLQTRANLLNSTIYNMVGQGAEYDPNTGTTLDEMMAEAAQINATIAETNPDLARRLNESVQQNIREGEWMNMFEQLPEAEKEEFIRDAETFDVDTKELKGEVLSPERRKRVISAMRGRWNRTKADNDINKGAIRTRLANAEKALLDGAGGSRDLNPLIERAYQAFDDETARGWEQRLMRAQEYANEISSVQELNMPDLVNHVSEAQADRDQARADFDAGKIDEADMNFEQGRLEALQQYQQGRSRQIADDPWNVMTPDKLAEQDLSTPDGVFEARAKIAVETGIPVHRIAPMSKSQIKNIEQDILNTETPTAQVSKLINLRKQLGETQFFRVFDEMTEIDEAFLPLALSENPQSAANMAQFIEDGGKLQKTASKVDTDKIRTEFDRQFGSTFNMQIAQGETYYDLYEKYYLVAEKMGETNPAARAFSKITAGRKIIELEGGHKQMVSTSTDQQRLQTAINNVRAEWQHLGIATRPGTSLNDFTYDQVTAQVHGNTVYFVDSQRNTVRLRTKNNTLIPLTIDIETYDIERAQQDSTKGASWNSSPNITIKPGVVYQGGNVAVSLKGDSENKLDQIANVWLNDAESRKVLDPAAPGMSNRQIDQTRLHSMSMVLRSGEMPDWLYDYMRKIPALEPSNERAFAALQKEWPQAVKQGYTTPGGASASPLLLLARTVQRVNKESRRQSIRRRN